MSIGQLVRRLLGKRVFALVGRYYRAIFINLDTLAVELKLQIPAGANLLDIGGGDGEPLNRILALRPDIRITMIDISANIGGAIEPRFKDRVTVFPSTSVDDFLRKTSETFNCILLSDVVHHVPVAVRLDFLKSIASLMAQSKAVWMIKDFAPGGLRSKLGYISDRYISGDRNVCFVSIADMSALIKQVASNVKIEEVGLFKKDAPNYLLKIVPS